jgi:hypothetical protein
MNTVKEFKNEIHTHFKMVFEKDGTWGGFASWFLVEMTPDSFFGTSSYSEETHWV